MILLLAASTVTENPIVSLLIEGCVAIALAIAIVRSRFTLNRYGVPVLAFMSLALIALILTPTNYATAVRVFLPTALLFAAAFDLRLDPAHMVRSYERAAVVQGVLIIGFNALTFSRTGGLERGELTGLIIAPFAMIGAVISGSMLILRTAATPAERRGHRNVLAISVVALVLTQTRGQLLASIAVVALVALFSRPNAGARRVGGRSSSLIRIGFVAALVLGTVAATTPALLDRFVGEGLSTSIGGRTTELKDSWRLIQEEPLYGHGVGFSFDNPIAAGNEQIVYVHNSLSYFALIGGFPLAIALIVIVMKLAGALNRRGHPTITANAASGLSLIIYSLTSAIQREAAFAIVLCVALSVSGSVVRSGHRYSVDRRQPPGDEAPESDQVDHFPGVSSWRIGPRSDDRRRAGRGS